MTSLPAESMGAAGCILTALLVGVTLLYRWLVYPGSGREAGEEAPLEVDFGGWRALFDMMFGSYESFRTERRSNEKTVQMFRKYGNTFVQHPPVRGPQIIWSIEPANIKTAWAMDFEAWGLQDSRAWAMAPFSGKGVVTTDGHLWQFSRSVLRPTFSRKRAADLASFEGLFRSFVDLLPADGVSIDVLPLLNRLGHDITCSLLFGHDVGAVGGTKEQVESAQEIMSAFDYCDLVVCKRMELPRFEVFCRDRRFRKRCDQLHKWIDDQIREVRAALQDNGSAPGSSAAHSPKYVVAKELLQQGIGDVAVREQIVNTFVAARGAVSSNLGHMLFLLARHPECWARLREEVIESGVLQAPSFDQMAVQLKALKCLHGIVNESFRLLPTLSFTERVASTETMLPKGGGADGSKPIAVRKGDTLVLNFAALHRSKRVFGEDADEFRPERWQDWQPPPWTFIPFGGGPRICIGRDFGLVQVSYALATLAIMFRRIENRDCVQDFVESYKLTTMSANGIEIALHRS